jgi:hypothetical protein
MYVIKLNGQIIYKSKWERPTYLLTILLRREGWGMVYMEHI